MIYQTPSGNVAISTSEALLVREDDRVEQLCQHGVGHPVGHLRQWQDWMSVHGCDGCCARADFYIQLAEEQPHEIVDEVDEEDEL